MGSFAEDTAQELQFTRQAQDEFALTSLERARRAVAEGAFRGEIVAIEGKQSVADDEDAGQGAARENSNAEARVP